MTWQRAQMVLLSAQGMDVPAIGARYRQTAQEAVGVGAADQG
jgi:hypothetical protein